MTTGFGSVFKKALKEAGAATLAAALVEAGKGVAKVATVTAEALKEEKSQEEKSQEETPEEEQEGVPA